MLSPVACLRLISTLSFVTAAIFFIIVMLEYAHFNFGHRRYTDLDSSYPTESSYYQLINLGGSMEPEMEESRREEYRQSIAQVVDRLPKFRETVTNCTALAKHSDFKLFHAAKLWKFDSQLYKEKLFENATDRCQAIKERLAFFAEPLSEEEKDFPLAYGMLVYDNPLQIYFLLSAIYQPQNAYCIAIDEKSTEEFKQDMELLSDCFPNIFVMHVSKVEWYTYSVVRGVWSCVRYLAQLRHPWKYYQYLSGVDLPLKTNLEMVRIFKQLNGTPNMDIHPIPWDRIQRVRDQQHPIPMFKSSLSGLISRESVNGMIESELVRQYLIFAQQLDCPDEALWATMLGNPQILNIPGTFNGSAMHSMVKQQFGKLPKRCKMADKNSVMENLTAEEPFALHTYYISRYQIWVYTPNTRCHGKFTHWSCVYGILDMTNLLSRPELIGHKFYLNIEPAAYFCIYETVRQRALDMESQRRFRGEVYSQLPQVKMAQSAPEQDLKFFFTPCQMDDN
ncbi:core-2/I-Branching enzyme domain-containing protein [Ditylenchus destructor]|uniref:Core-2/I-Branching enzyme domain-containing protein n=1 Tax=Ditylenchus destructor TaxID=166010 RepID=A0AAD4MVD7_9BILA|nr:core-2/I-Branching enzyme domain-containing protein [Ditylenchus destructor]